MKKLLLKIFLLSFLVGTLLLVLFLFCPKPANDPVYEAAILDKHGLLDQIRSPRIIFIGGSGLAFGLDSLLIEQSMGMPVINMGLHAGLGLRYMLSEIKPSIGKGDVLVIIPEYEQFFGSAFDGGFDLAFIAMRFPGCRQYLTSWKQYMAIISNAPYAFRASLYNLLSHERFSTSFAYCRAAFNAYGDSVGHLNRVRPTRVIKYGHIDGQINQEAIAAVNDLGVYARRQGAKVFFIYPALEQGQYKLSEKEINLLDSVLRKGAGVPVLGKPSEDVFPEDCFYDSVYHLNAAARQIRTQRIMVRLKGVL